MIKMPYAGVEEVVKRFPKLKKYPPEAREMFLKVINAALEQYPDDEGKAIATAWAAINKKYGRRDEAELRFMSATLMAPFTEFEGIIKVPTIFTREGVQNRGFKPFEELVKGAPTLEGKPVLYWHPPEMRPANITDMIVGSCSDVEAREQDRVLHGLTNIRVGDAPPQFINEVRRGETREGSVGYWSESEYVSGNFQGDEYERIERNIRFDHYAVGIPLGACSVEQGCGLGFDQEQGVNNMSDLEELETGILEKVRNWWKNLRTDYNKAPLETKEDEEMARLNEEEKQRYEREIAKLKEAKETLEGEKTQWEQEKDALTSELQGYKDKEQEAIDKQRGEIIDRIVEATKEEKEKYAEYSLAALQHFEGLIVKPTDMRGKTPPGGAGGEGGEKKISIEIRGKELTVGDLMKKPAEP